MRLVLAVEYKLLGIPYHRSADGHSHSFVDLRANPAGIDLIPEAAKWPELKATLECLNDTKRPFRTLGCAEFEYVSAPQPYTDAYVTFCFVEPRERENEHNYYALFHNFGGFLVNQASLPDQLNIRMELRNTVFYEENNLRAWSLEFWVQGLGKNTEERRRLPALGFSILRDFADGIQTR